MDSGIMGFCNPSFFPARFTRNFQESFKIHYISMPTMQSQWPLTLITYLYIILKCCCCAERIRFGFIQQSCFTYISEARLCQRKSCFLGGKLLTCQVLCKLILILVCSNILSVSGTKSCNQKTKLKLFDVLIVLMLLQWKIWLSFVFFRPNILMLYACFIYFGITSYRFIWISGLHFHWHCKVTCT